MIYAERKTDQGFHYNVEDIFGVIDIYSARQLTGNDLDALVMTILRTKVTSGEVNGLSFTFKIRPMWEDVEDPIIEELSIFGRAKEWIKLYFVYAIKKTIAFLNGIIK